MAGWPGGAVGATSSPFMGGAATGAVSADAPQRLLVSRLLVRPGRKGGGTTVVFRLRGPMLLRVTVVRVFPTCDVLGAFRVRGRAGVNRVPFRGRFRGRPLSNGTYRLVVSAPGMRTAEATIVVARRKMSIGKLREARSANACVPVLPVGFDSAAAPLPVSEGSGGASGNDGVGGGIVSAAKGAVKESGALAGRAKDALKDPAPLSLLTLVLVGALTLMAAALGAFVLFNVQRLRQRSYR
jgi:hypothetical protein